MKDKCLGASKVGLALHALVGDSGRDNSAGPWRPIPLSSFPSLLLIIRTLVNLSASLIHILPFCNAPPACLRIPGFGGLCSRKVHLWQPLHRD